MGITPCSFKYFTSIFWGPGYTVTMDKTPDDAPTGTTFRPTCCSQMLSKNVFDFGGKIKLS